MKQHDFEQKYNASWLALEQSIEKNKTAEMTDFPASYRTLCHHLALAKHRRYGAHLIDRLNQLVLQCHHHLYRPKSQLKSQWLHFLAIGFPSLIRANHYYVWLAVLCFLLPALALFFLCYLNDSIIYSVMSADQVRDFEAMYDPSARVLGRDRESDTDIMMFGHYIKNNIGISFQTFAGGIAFGLGTLFYLIFNGIHLGAVFGHISHIGFFDTFYPFVIGHGAFELTGLVLSGAAGLKLGFALINPGPYRRITALQIAGKDAIKIIYGTTIMLLIAAFLEAFWSSSSTLSINVKYTVGGIFWLMVILYFLFSGRRYHHGS